MTLQHNINYLKNNPLMNTKLLPPPDSSVTTCYLDVSTCME